MLKWFTFFSLLSISTLAMAQIELGLVAYISFDSCNADINSGNTSLFGFVNGNPTCECGVKGKALRLDGLNDYIEIVGAGVSDRFQTEDFSVSFYFKPIGAAGMQTIVSKTGDDCSTQGHFAVRYDGNPNQLNVQMVENSNKTASLTRVPLSRESCWHHIAVVRRNNKTILYIDGKFVAENGAANRVNTRNSGQFRIGESFCSQTDRFFSGLIDELRIYNRSLKPEEVEDLYLAPDKILTENTRIFLGESVDIDISGTCAKRFNWTPANNVSNPADPRATLSPTETTTYTLAFSDDLPCIATDTINIVVIDPATLDCETVFLPKAFTPNGDGLNDFYGISNPEIFTVGGGTLNYFEIFDRWGNLVFSTTDPTQTWDGSYKGEMLNPGVLLYKVQYACSGQERVEAGSLTILR